MITRSGDNDIIFQKNPSTRKKQASNGHHKNVRLAYQAALH